MTTDQGEYDKAVSAAEEEWFDIWVHGPEVTRWETLPVQVGDVAPPFSLPDQDGSLVSLAELVSNGPALVLFWRHFGCGCGVDRAARLRDETAAYLDLGANVVIIGQGQPIQAAAYAEEHGIEVPVLTDPDRSVYRAYGLLDAHMSQVLFDAPQWMWSYSPEVAEKFQEERRASGRRLVNNPWTLPGEFVIGSNGTILHTHRYQHCEDWPDPRVHLTAISGGSVVVDG